MDQDLRIVDVNLKDKWVVVTKESVKPQFHDIKSRLFKAEGGFGCNPNSLGNAVFGRYADETENSRIERYNIERLASEEEIKLAESLIAQSK